MLYTLRYLLAGGDAETKEISLKSIITMRNEINHLGLVNIVYKFLRVKWFAFWCKRV